MGAIVLYHQELCAAVTDLLDISRVEPIGNAKAAVLGVARHCMPTAA
jgi:hypothetical protein